MSSICRGSALSTINISITSLCSEAHQKFGVWVLLAIHFSSLAMLSKRWIREDREEWGVPPPLGTKGKTIDSSRKVWSSGCQGIYDILCGPASQWHAVTSRPVPQPTLFVATQPLSWPINNINLPFLGSKGCRNYTKALIFAFSMTKDRADKRHWCRIDTTTSSNSRTLWLFVSPPPPPVIKSTFVSSTVALYAIIH